jgi:hypothetical protein
MPAPRPQAEIEAALDAVADWLIEVALRRQEAEERSAAPSTTTKPENQE